MPSASKRLAIEGWLSSAARIPLPGGTRARAVASRAGVVMESLLWSVDYPHLDTASQRHGSGGAGAWEPERVGVPPRQGRVAPPPPPSLRAWRRRARPPAPRGAPQRAAGRGALDPPRRHGAGPA